MVLTRRLDDPADLIDRIESALRQAGRGRSPFIYTSNSIADQEASFYVVGDKRTVTPLLLRLNTELRLGGRLAWASMR